MNRPIWKYSTLDTLLVEEKKKVVYLDRPSPLEAVNSFWSDMRQVQIGLIEIGRVLQNKERRDDFSPDEWAYFVDCLQQILYIEHSARRLKKSMKQLSI